MNYIQIIENIVYNNRNTEYAEGSFTREESTKQSGMLGLAISAIIYGITPILARFSYDGGSNGIMVTLLRNLIPIPVLFLIVRFNNVEFIVSKEDRRKLYTWQF